MSRCREESRTALSDSGHPPWAAHQGGPDTTNIPSFCPYTGISPANLVLSKGTRPRITGEIITIECGAGLRFGTSSCL